MQIELPGRVWVAAIGLLLTVTAVAAQQAQDSRLDSTITCEQTAGTVGDYLEAISEATEVAHQVDEPFGERGLVALNIKQPLRRIHRGLGLTYELTWRTAPEDPPHYRLREGIENEVARRRALEAVVRKGRDSLVKRVGVIRQLLTRSPTELKALAAQGEAMANTLLHPVGLSLRRLALSLPDPVWQQLWTTGNAQVMLRDLPPTVQDLAIAGIPHVHPDPDSVRRDGSLNLSVGGTLDRPTVWMRFRFGARGGVDSNLFYTDGFTRELPRTLWEQAGRPRTQAPRDRRFNSTVTLTEEALQPDSERPREARERPRAAKPLALLLQELAEQVDLPILAECEHEPDNDKWLRQQWWLTSNITEKPLPDALDLLCADFDFEWRFEDGCLILRPRLWYVDPGRRGYVYPAPPSKM